MRPIGVADMITVDRLMVDEYGITLIQMMENAGRGLAAVARALLGGDVAGRRIVVLAGKGNNGGGGLAAARHLANAGADIAVAVAAPPGELGEAPEHQRRVLARLGLPGSDRATGEAALPALLAGADLILDALIGYRLRCDPRPPIAGFIAAANTAVARRLALDLPSGLDGDRGSPASPTVRADATATLAWPKAGLLTPAAAPCVGALYLADIGVPMPVYRAVGVEPGPLFARGPVVRVERRDDGWAPLPEIGSA